MDNRDNIFNDVLYYAVKQLETEIKISRDAEDYILLDILETMYSYWKQLLSADFNSEDFKIPVSVDVLNEVTEKARLYDEKQLPQKVNMIDLKYGVLRCSKCLSTLGRENYCPHCGQKIEYDFSDPKEKKCKFAVLNGNTQGCLKSNYPYDMGDCLFKQGVINVKASALCTEALKLKEKQQK